MGTFTFASREEGVFCIDNVISRRLEEGLRERIPLFRAINSEAASKGSGVVSFQIVFI